nr:tyrosine-type recombinase/integrase [Rhodovulum kholense]
MNAIAALRLDDIEDRGDHMVLTITHAKTEAGNRKVFVVGPGDCKLLREAMSRARISEPASPDDAGMLFPRITLGGYEKRPSHYLGKALEAARKSLDGPASDWDMHSFRRAGVSALVNAGVDTYARNLAVGHSNKGDIGVSVYARRADLSEILKATFEALFVEQGGLLAGRLRT